MTVSPRPADWVPGGRSLLYALKLGIGWRHGDN